MTYNPKENYCTLSPDKILGVNINYGCYLHDRQYRNEVKKRKTRLEADKELQRSIENDFLSAGKPRLGYIVGFLYFLGVRIMGLFTWVRPKRKV